MIEIIHYKIRRYDSDVYVTLVPKHKDIIITPCLGNPSKKQKITDIVHNWHETRKAKKIMGINFSFFDGSSSKPLGTHYTDSGITNNPGYVGSGFLQLALYKNNLIIAKDLLAKDIPAKYPGMPWCISGSYSLVIDGKKDIMHGSYFPWTNERHPRTLMGDNKDYFIFVVVEGRKPSGNPVQKGITANESAAIMLELGAITAINADGGWSSAKDIEGKVVNKSYITGGQRPLSDAILVYAAAGAEYKIVSKETDKTTPPIAETAKKEKVVWDIGHGIDSYPPNKGVPGFAEFEFNNAVVKMGIPLAEHNGFEIILSQPIDGKEVSLSARATLINKSGASLLMSFHADAHSDPSANGNQRFYWKGSANGLKFANILEKNAKLLLPMKTRPNMACSADVSWPNFAILRNTNPPAVLQEHGFMTNKDDLSLLKSDNYRRLCAEVAVRSMCEYFGKSFKPLVEETPVTPPSSLDKYKITTAVLNARDNKMGKIIGVLSLGDIVEVVGVHESDKDWVIVRKDSFISYVNKNYMTKI